MDFFNAQLNNGDIKSAINTSLMEAAAAKKVAQDGIQALEEAKAKMKALREQAIAAYPLL